MTDTWWQGRDLDYYKQKSPYVIEWKKKEGSNGLSKRYSLVTKRVINESELCLPENGWRSHQWLMTKKITTFLHCFVMTNWPWLLSHIFCLTCKELVIQKSFYSNVPPKISDLSIHQGHPRPSSGQLDKLLFLFTLQSARKKAWKTASNGSFPVSRFIDTKSSQRNTCLQATTRGIQLIGTLSLAKYAY